MCEENVEAFNIYKVRKWLGKTGSFQGWNSYEIGSVCHDLKGSIYPEETSHHCDKQCGTQFLYYGSFDAMKSTEKIYKILRKSAAHAKETFSKYLHTLIQKTIQQFSAIIDVCCEVEGEKMKMKGL